MFKLTIVGVMYNLMFVSMKTGEEVLVLRTPNITAIVKLIEEEFQGKVQIDGHSGLYQAVKEMRESDHNTAEFGMMNGLFTVSYYDNTLRADS